jgi:hypothetical protein
VVVCGFGLEEVVYPEWVEVSLHVAEVRAVTVVVSRVSDRRSIISAPLEITDGVATIRLSGLAPGTAYSTEYVVVDDFGRSTAELAGGFTTARNR